MSDLCVSFYFGFSFLLKKVRRGKKEEEGGGWRKQCAFSAENPRQVFIYIVFLELVLRSQNAVTISILSRAESVFWCFDSLSFTRLIKGRYTQRCLVQPVKVKLCCISPCKDSFWYCTISDRRERKRQGIMSFVRNVIFAIFWFFFFFFFFQ